MIMLQKSIIYKKLYKMNWLCTPCVQTSCLHELKVQLHKQSQQLTGHGTLKSLLLA